MPINAHKVRVGSPRRVADTPDWSTHYVAEPQVPLWSRRQHWHRWFYILFRHTHDKYIHSSVWYMFCLPTVNIHRILTHNRKYLCILCVFLRPVQWFLFVFRLNVDGRSDRVLAAANFNVLDPINIGPEIEVRPNVRFWVHRAMKRENSLHR